MKTISTFLLVLLCSVNTFAADFYWVGGNGNWSDFQHHWALSSGGNVFQTTVPSAFDNVYFDTNSFPLATDSIVVLDNSASYTKDLVFNLDQKKVRFLFYNSSSLYIYGSANFADQLMMLNSPSIYFKSNIPNRQVSFNKIKSWPNSSLHFDGVGGSWDITDSLVIIKDVYLDNGELNITGKKLRCTNFYSLTTSNRNLKFSYAQLYINFISTNGTNFSQEPLYSHLHSSNISNTGSKITFDTLSQYPIEFLHQSQYKGIKASNVSIKNSSTTLTQCDFTQFTLQTGTLTIEEFKVGVAQISAVNKIYLSYTLTITNDFIITGTNDCTERMYWIGKPQFSPTISKASGIFTFRNALINDIYATGGAIFNTLNSYDLGNNIGINFSNSVKTYYWIGDSGNWEDPLHWSLTSGGTSSNCFPSPTDKIIFDQQSFLTDSPTHHLIINEKAYCGTIDATALSKNLDISGEFYTSGSVYLSPLLNNINIRFTSNLPGNEIDLNGAKAKVLTFDGQGEWSFIDSVYCEAIQQWRGYIRSNGYKINTSNFNQIYTSNGGDFSNSTFIIHYAMSAFINSILNTSTVILPKGGSVFSQGRIKEVISYGGTLEVVADAVGKTISHGNSNLGIAEMDTLLVQESSTVLLHAPNIVHVDSIGILPHPDACGKLTSFLTLDPTATVKIIKETGTLFMHHAILSGIKAEGGATFIAHESVDLINNSGWLFSASPSRTFFWIGNSGDWNDPMHWSLQSGGMPYGCVPQVQDHVLFDMSSFTKPDQVVTKQDDLVKISGLTVQDIPKNINFHIENFEVYGNIELHKNLTGKTRYSMYGERQNTFKSNTCHVTGLYLRADTVNILDDFKGESFVMQKGVVNLLQHHIKADLISAGAPFYLDSLIFDIRNCTLETSQFKVNSYNTRILSENSLIKLTSGYDEDLIITGDGNYHYPHTRIKLHRIQIINPGNRKISLINTEINSLQVDSSAYKLTLHLNASTINEFYCKSSLSLTVDAVGIIPKKSSIGMAQWSSDIQLNGEVRIGYLRLDAGSNLEIHANDTLYTYEYFDAVGTSSSPISISSSMNGQQAIISCPSGQICCSYLSLSNIKASGGAIFYAGPSSTNIYNNTGWDFNSSCDLLRINAPIACLHSQATISTTHSPFINGFLWSGPNDFYSNSANIVITPVNASTTGLYTLHAGGQVRKILLQNELKPDTTISIYNYSYSNWIELNSPYILSANNYSIQWFKDDVLYNQDNLSRISPMENGFYHASFTSPNNCTYKTNSVYYTTDDLPVSLYPPYNLEAVTGSSAQVTLAWQDINTYENADGFEIYRSDSENGVYTLIGSVGYTLSYEDYTALFPGTHYYKVRAVKFPGHTTDYVYSDYSNIASVTLNVLSNTHNIQSRIIIKPVPVEELLTIESIALIKEVSVYDHLGSLILNQTIDDKNSVTLDANFLKQGIYILKVITSESESYTKLVK